MAGDVFGNGMLLSRHLKLVAAFNHEHVFLDPDPDPEPSYAERERLFALPRSSWADYDTAAISAGGGVFPRTAKSIPLSPEARAAAGRRGGGADAERAWSTRSSRAEVDLLWNGGIGTFVKASTESHLDVGDKANDALRVDARDLRAPRRRRGRQPRPHPARPRRVRARRRADLHRRDRQLGGRRLLRPRGEHQDPARRRRGHRAT